ncbi:MAG: PKD domain-containing protein [Anaerosomatales bacterium]|nr:PKD domain-containing protein [Anaerosomatales bacterium]MDT8434249.1 PKD domain-containing protein [Anaerosomatales bacterium]
MATSLRKAISVASLVALLMMSLGTMLPASSATAKDVPASVRLERETSGEDAIRALGPDIAAVASAHGKSVSELARAFRSDKRLFVDPSGRLFYREAPVTPEEAAGAEVAEGSGTALAPNLDSTFKLHSRPGSKRTLYLDFDGHTLSGTAWNTGSVPGTLVCPPWDLDGDPSTFNSTEQARIIEIWQRVAEDYAPFDINVTTEAPAESALTRSSSSDEYYGVRVLISPISSYFGAYGGIAYVGVFDAIGDTYKPALVFPERLANGAKYIAEAASHEAGHTLGLLHDGTTTGASYYGGHGTGETGWAPVMGTGYSRNLTQWSRGEYANANNTEDDYVIMKSNGLSPRPDDHPDGPAWPKPVADGTLSASGVIEHPDDVDVVSFTAGAGAVSLSVTPSTVGPNLDIGIELRDENGNVIAQSNPVDLLGASLTSDVSEGVYHLYITGVGKAGSTGYPEYGSLGTWTLAGTAPSHGGQLPPTAVATASVTSGEAPLSLALDGSGSFDPDGTIVSWAWDFGDGTSGTGATVAHTYASAGSYTVRLTVTDNGDLTATASVAIDVTSSNVAPTAMIVTSGGGDAPATFTFDGSDSSDPDGSVASWAWSFGDGSTGAGPTVNHTYANAGTYSVKLVVTDDRGASATATTSVTVTEPPVVGQVAMRIDSVDVGLISKKSTATSFAIVRVTDTDSRPLEGVMVSGSWSGPLTGTSTGVTGADGTVRLDSPRSFKPKATVSFTVTLLEKAGYVHDSSLDSTDSASYTIDSGSNEEERTPKGKPVRGAQLIR